MQKSPDHTATSKHAAAGTEVLARFTSRVRRRLIQLLGNAVNTALL
jgi:hypothetical protein